MRSDQFAFFCHMIRQRSGISLTPEKAYLANARLKPIMKTYGYSDLVEFFEYLATTRNERVLSEVTDAMTTNESFFFRDDTPFQNFVEVVLPELKKTRDNTKTIRVWCAACSSGQEPYSLAMIFEEIGALWPDWHFQIVATDISEAMIARAREGWFSDFEVNRGLTNERKERFFEKSDSGWIIDASLRRMIEFRQFNLLDDPQSLGRFDVVFCRNVLIYFEPKTKSEILDRIAAVLTPDGFLSLGAAETVVGLTKSFLPSTAARPFYTRANATLENTKTIHRSESAA